MSTLSLGEGALHHAVQGRSPPSLRCTQCQSESSECAVQLNPNCKVIQTDAGQQLSLCTNQAQRAQRKGLVTVWTWGLRCGCGEPRPPLAVSPQSTPRARVRPEHGGLWFPPTCPAAHLDLGQLPRNAPLLHVPQQGCHMPESLRVRGKAMTRWQGPALTPGCLGPLPDPTTSPSRG